MAGTLGGILANSSRPDEWFYDNLLIHATVLHRPTSRARASSSTWDRLASIPGEAPQPMAEEALLTGVLQATDEPYAAARIAGIKLCQAYRRQLGCDFILAMPTNFYGSDHKLDLESSQALPAMIRRFHHAKISGIAKVVHWGSGSPGGA